MTHEKFEKRWHDTFGESTTSGLDEIKQHLLELDDNLNAIVGFFADPESLSKAGSTAGFLALCRKYFHSILKIEHNENMPTEVKKEFMPDIRIMPIVLIVSSLICRDIVALRKGEQDGKD